MRDIYEIRCTNTQNSSLILKFISVVAAREKKAAENLAREAVYLGILNKERVHKYLAYEHRQLIKEGRRESCKQRKRRLRKESLANKRAA